MYLPDWLVLIVAPFWLVGVWTVVSLLADAYQDWREEQRRSR